jgi:hypothetical protein
MIETYNFFFHLVEKTQHVGFGYTTLIISLAAAREKSTEEWRNENVLTPWISYTIDDGYVYIASFQPMGRFSDFSATGK